MTKQKSFKRRVRARMEKTDESYSAARRQLLAKADPAHGGERASVPAASPATADSGVEAPKTSDAAVAARTGREPGEWFGLLDEWGAGRRTHREIARWLREEQGVPWWWAQSITVAYEQARGIRDPGKMSDGRYSVGVSKTVGVPVERLYEAFEDHALRESWLPGERLEVTTSRGPKSFRAKWGDGGTRIAVGFYPKDKSRSQVSIAHEKSTPEEAKELKAFWSERFGALKVLLES